MVDNVGIFGVFPVSPVSSHQRSPFFNSPTSCHFIFSFIHFMSSFTSFMVRKNSWFVGDKRGQHFVFLYCTLSHSEYCLGLNGSEMTHHHSSFQASAYYQQKTPGVVLVAAVPRGTDLLTWLWHRRVAFILSTQQNFLSLSEQCYLSLNSH